MVDYSKWENIELSDEEEDRNLLVFLRDRKNFHKLRLTKLEKQREELLSRKQGCQTQVAELQEKLNANVDVEQHKAALEYLLLEQNNFANEEVDWQKKFDRVSSCFPALLIVEFPHKLTSEESDARMSKFIAKNEKLYREYAFLNELEESKCLLLSHPKLICVETLNCLGLLAIFLMLEKKVDVIKQIARQCACVHRVVTLAEKDHANPRDCVAEIFEVIQSSAPDFRAAFAQDITKFEKRIKEVAAKEAKFRRLGPGGLDPDEVLAELPPQLKTSFEANNVEALLGLMDKLPNEQADYYMNLLGHSGLWDSMVSKALSHANTTKTNPSDVD